MDASSTSMGGGRTFGILPNREIGTDATFSEADCFCWEVSLCRVESDEVVRCCWASGGGVNIETSSRSSSFANSCWAGVGRGVCSKSISVEDRGDMKLLSRRLE